MDVTVSASGNGSSGTGTAGFITDHRLDWWADRVHELGAAEALPLATAKPGPVGGARRRVQSSLDIEKGARHLHEIAGSVQPLFEAGLAAFLSRQSVSAMASFAVADGDDWLMLMVDLSTGPDFGSICHAVASARSLARTHYAPPDAIATRVNAGDDGPPLVSAAIGPPGCDWSAVPPTCVRLEVQGAQFTWDAPAELFDDRSLAEMDDRFTRLLKSACTNPGSPLPHWEILGIDERRRLFVEMNGPQVPVPPACAHDLIKATAQRSPARVAVVSGGASLTYAALDALSDDLAAALVRLGAGPGQLVGVYIDRSEWMLVALLGVMKSGAAYVPIDPSYPDERVTMMLDDAGIRIVVTHCEVGPILSRPGLTVVDAEKLSTSRAAGTPPNGPADGAARNTGAATGATAAHGSPRRTAGPSDLAYVIFTSGSTGRPKGVMVEHGALVNLLLSMGRSPGLSPTDRLLAVTTLSFDIAALELYLPLVVGATVVIADRRTVLDPRALSDLISAQAVTVMQATPATWQMLVDDGWPGAQKFRALCGGEALPPALADALLDRVNDLWNLYGPTETTIWSTSSRVTKGRPVTIGRPIANTQAYVVGRHLELLPAGVTGELLLGGKGVARGYWGQPELTAERFVPDPFSSEPGARAYRTGDLVRLVADGSLEYSGRRDHQVKVRGFRIELTEVESALASHPDVARAVVVVRGEGTGRVLVGYVTPAPDASPSPTALRHHVKTRLPEYMVPSSVQVLASFPLTPNGKVDRRALPAPAGPAGAGAHVAPRDSFEARVVALWEEVLNIRPISTGDNFFDLGADSLTAARLFARLRAEFAIDLPLTPLFQAPTPADLAQLVRDAQTGRATARYSLQSRPARADGKGRTYSALVAIQPEGTRPPLFLMHGGAGTVLLYEPLARLLGEDQPVYGLQAVGLYGEQAPQYSVGAMAEYYLDEIRSVQGAGPYRLGGYCYGALVAFEMARRLKSRGEAVALLVSFNGPSPSYLRQHHPGFDNDGPVDTRGRPLAPGDGAPAEHKMGAAADLAPGTTNGRGNLADLGRLKVELLQQYRRYKRILTLWMLVWLRRPLPDHMREHVAFQRISMRAQERYWPAAYDGDMIVVSARDLYQEPDLGWSRHTSGNVTSIIVPGRQRIPRDTMSGACAAYVADRLKAELGPASS